MDNGFGSDVLMILGLLIVFGAVLFVAWLTTKFLGKKLAGSSKNKTMKVVESLQIGLDRCLYLIKVANRYFLFNASKKSLDLVSEIYIDEESLAAAEASGKNANVFDFKRIFEFYSGLGKKEKKADNAENPTGEAVGEPGTGGGLLRNVRRLRKMTGEEEQYKG